MPSTPTVYECMRCGNWYTQPLKPVFVVSREVIRTSALSSANGADSITVEHGDMVYVCHECFNWHGATNGNGVGFKVAVHDS